MPTLRSDLLLLHAPAFFDFRQRRDIYFPYLGTSGDVPITPLYEYFPVGFRTLQRFLRERGHEVRLLNLSSLLLRYPALAIDDIVAALDVDLVGIDLHWMIHVQGVLEVASIIKRIRPDLPVILGGISSTYYARELVQYPFIDMVMRGYDTHQPMHALLACLKQGQDPIGVANLLWKRPDGGVVDNGFSHKPASFSCGIDWSTTPRESPTGTLPILEFLSTQHAGCSFHCGWCGGSREAFKRVFGPDVPETVIRKSEPEMAYEFASLRGVANHERYHFYAIGSYAETSPRLDFFIDQVASAGLKSVSYEQYHLTSDDVLKRMAAANPRTSITLSPESSNPRIGHLAGRGAYTMEEMEAWIDRALSFGISQVDLWFFVGMPEQDEDAVKADVAYCAHLLDRFSGKRVAPFICPMIPFLDPGSTFFTHPEEHGYRVFFRTAEEHRQGMRRASIINRTNYETRWLRRADLVRVGYEAVSEVMQLRGQTRQLPFGVVSGVRNAIADALKFIEVVHQADSIDNSGERTRALEALGDEIAARNHAIFFQGVANQAFPINRQIRGRWFDELGWPASDLDACC